jgi:hypothetical protein
MLILILAGVDETKEAVEEEGCVEEEDEGKGSNRVGCEQTGGGRVQNITSALSITSWNNLPP